MQIASFLESQLEAKKHIKLPILVTTCLKVSRKQENWAQTESAQPPEEAIFHAKGHPGGVVASSYAIMARINPILSRCIFNRLPTGMQQNRH